MSNFMSLLMLFLITLSLTAAAEKPKKSDILLRQFETGNYGEIAKNTAISEHFQADWYNWLFHHWRPITQPDKTEFYQEISDAKQRGLKIQARVEFDANWKTFAEYFVLENIDHKANTVRSLEGLYQLYPAHMGMLAGKNCSGKNCASSRFSDTQLAQGEYTGKTHDFSYNNSNYSIPPFYYSTHSAHTQALLKKQVDVLMGGSLNQTIGFVLGGNVDAIMFDSQTTSAKTLYWAGDFSTASISDFNDHLATEYVNITAFNDALQPYQSSANFTEFEQFDYQQFLLALNYKDDDIQEAVYLNNTVSIPLFDAFKRFQVKAHGELLQVLKSYANNFKDNTGAEVPDIDISSSGKIDYPVAGTSPESIDFYSQEEQGDIQKIKLLYKTAQAQGKSLTFNHGPPDWNKMAEISAVNQPRYLMAHGYAYGANYVVPIKNDSYLSSPGDFEVFTDFIAANNDLFDGYISHSKVGLLHSYEAMEASKAHRVNGAMPAIYAVDTLLEANNIQYNLVSFGGDLWPFIPDSSQVSQYDVIVTTQDINYLTSVQQQALNDFSTSTTAIVSVVGEADLEKLFSKIGSKGYLSTVNADGKIELVLRKNSNNSTAPVVVHLLNKTLNNETDFIEQQENVTVRLDDVNLFDQAISAVHYYSLDTNDMTPQCIELPIDEKANQKEFTIPNLDIWAVAVLSLENGEQYQCNDYPVTLITTENDDVDLGATLNENLVVNGYLLDSVNDWQALYADFKVSYDESLQSYVGHIYNREKQSATARAIIDVTAGHSYSVSVLSKTDNPEDDLRITYLYTNEQGNNVFVNLVQQKTSLADGWQQLSGEFSIPEDITASNERIYIKTTSSVNDVYFDKFEVVDLTVTEPEPEPEPSVVIADVQLIGALAGNKLVIGDSITLDGSNSSDSKNLTLSYQWSQLNGPAITLLDADKVKASFKVPSVNNDADVSFQLTVTNNENVSANIQITAIILATKKPSINEVEKSSGGSFGGVLALFVFLNLLSRLIITRKLMKFPASFKN